MPQCTASATGCANGTTHGPVWSVWATLEGTHSEELFEASSEEEASNWISTDGKTWLEERRQKRNS